MNRHGRRSARPALVTAALCSLLCVLVARPAYAEPTPPAAPTITAPTTASSPGVSVPDAGVAPVTTNTATTSLPADIGPLAAQITSERNAVELLTEQVTAMGEDVQRAQDRANVARADWNAAHDAAVTAQQQATDAASRAYQDADALGPLDGLADEISGLSVLAPGFAPGATPPDPNALAAVAAQAQQREDTAKAAYDAAQATADALTSQQSALSSGRDQRNAALQDLVARNQTAAAAAEAVQESRSAALAGMYAAGSNVKGMVANPKALKAVQFALDQRGKKYVMGAEGPNEYDCSGLVWAAYRSVGVNLPRTAHEQQHALAPIPASELLPGDLIFFNPTSTTDWTTVSHVGIYYGNGQMIEAPTYNQVVKIAPVWWAAYFSAARVIPAVPGPATVTATPTHTPGPTPSSAAPTSAEPSTPPSSAPPSSTPPSSAPPSSAPPSSGTPSPSPSPSSPSPTSASPSSKAPSDSPSPKSEPPSNKSTASPTPAG